MSETLNLHQRLLRVMASMGAIGKTGQATYGDKYAYHKIDDIDDELRKALVEHGVTAMVVAIEDRKLDHYPNPPDRYGAVKMTWYCECTIKIELVNADDPEDKCHIVGWGQGLDNSDKATGKAISYAAKAAYLSAFHLRGQPDNEEDNITRPPVQAPATKPAPPPATQPAAVSDKAQQLVIALNQPDDIKSLKALLECFKKESAAVQKELVPFVAERIKAVWKLELTRCPSLEDLQTLGKQLSGEPDEHKDDELREIFTAKSRGFRL